jgi:ATP-dependent helicase HrpA
VAEPFPDLNHRIDAAIGADRPRLRSLLRRIRDAARSGQPHDRNLARLHRELDDSVSRRLQRVARRPRVAYPEDLPIAERRAEVAEALASRQVVVVAGETGSGKSTQLPKLCLDVGRGIDGMIGHTQPRRIAARALAKRVGEELGDNAAVGFKVRFTDTTRPDSYIKLMTDGILLAETQHDRLLLAYDTIIVDEAHERSLNIDFLLGYLHQLLPKRPDLKLIITSATIDPQRFAEHFADPRLGPAPVVEVSGRTYPVEVRYRPLQQAADDDHEVDEATVQQGVAAALEELSADPVTSGGDVLVFLPTERDIRATARHLRGVLGPTDPTQVLPLYARLSATEQDRVFRPTGGGRRIVLATNVAETSLTVPGVRGVIDVGTARISRYSARAGVQRLPIEAVSQASADQRKGRCGRVAPGVCIRLYSEDDFAGRERFTPPEILRTDLASVILRMKAVGLGEVESFPFLDPPRPGAVRDGYATLYELQAIGDDNELTPLGRRLSQLPTDPRVGRIILAADRENCLAEVLVIAAAMETQDPRLRPVESRQAADEAHAKFRVEGSDFLSLLKVWEFYHGLKENLTRGALQRACVQNFLSHVRLREWADIHRQLRDMCGDLRLKPGAFDPWNSDARRDAIHRSLLAGLLSNIAMRGEGFEYTGAGGKKLWLWPGSSLFEAKPRWIVAAELVETTRLYARTAAAISVNWIEPLAEHLVTRTHSEPHWDRDAGQVAAYEKVLLYGLTLSPRRKVAFGGIDPSAARELFIHHALVLGDVTWPGRGGTPGFVKANRDLIERIEKVEAKARRRDLLADERARSAFFDVRVPPGVYDVRSFETWRREAERSNAKLLHMTESDLLTGSADSVTRQAFPDAIEVGTVSLPLEYHLEPGAGEDGVTIITPLPALRQLDAHRLQWLVPGLLKEKVTELIRSLPKQVRKAFVPAPDWAEKVVGRLDFGRGPLDAAVARALAELSGMPLGTDAFDESQLPSHLRMNVRVVDDRRKVLASGRDLSAVMQAVGVEAAESFASAGDERFHRDGIRAWDFGELPDTVRVRRSGLTLPAYPAIVDNGDAVSLRLMDTPDRAAHETAAGLRRLVAMQVGREVRHHVDRLPQLERLTVQLSTVAKSGPLREQLVDLVIDRAFVADQPSARDAAAFEERLNAGWNRIAGVTADVGTRVAAIGEAFHRASLALADVPASPAFAAATADTRGQVQRLMADGFLTCTPWTWLLQYPRYLGGVQLRMQKLRGGGAARDAHLQAKVVPLWRACIERMASHHKRGLFDGELQRYRWMLEEWRVSLFAQELGTSVPVSLKRLEQQWSKTRA